MTKALQTLWNRQLKLQVQISSARDRLLFGRLPRWSEAKTIIDLGCGSGAFLKQVHCSYPNKTYFALDKDSQMLSSVPKYLHPICSDVDSADRALDYRVDYVISRALVQHLSSHKDYLRTVARLLKPGGYLLIIDAEDSQLDWTPHLPEVERALNQLSERQRSIGVGRNWWPKLKEVASDYGFSQVFSQVDAHKSSSYGNKGAFYKLFRNLGTLLQLHFKIQFNSKLYNEELDAWFRQRNTHAQYGMRAVVLRRSY